jgi:dTDP-4-amino-4,6-dideoxygalactose transaminase
VLALMAEGVGPGDAVVVPSFTFIATAEAVCLVGATPVFCDVDERTFNMCPISLAASIAHVKTLGLPLKAVISVDMFGLPANYDEIETLAEEHNFILICDAAQGFGGTLRGKRTGGFGTVTTTSFFPAKPLGCYGDGGALFTNDDDLADRLRSLRVHGKGTDKYDNVRIGQNSRLDTIQAAVLMEKLGIFEAEIDARNRVAARYNESLSGVAKTPVVVGGYGSAWAQYTLIVEDREAIAQACREKGVPTAIYYPVPMHLQSAYNSFPCGQTGGLAVSEYLSKHVISLPMHPYLSDEDQNQIIDVVMG